MVEPTSLANDGIDQCHGILDGHAGENRLGRGEHVAASFPITSTHVCTLGRTCCGVP